MVDYGDDVEGDSRREEIEKMREMAESVDSPAKPEDYVIMHGKYRMVRPYHFDFLCSVKARWAGRGIVDIFTKEFPALSKEYYLRAVSLGLLRVEGMPELSAATPLPPGARMRHLVHRHEPPVLATSVTVLDVTPDLVAVCKPPGMPVHVAGQYRKNTVLGILGAERPDLGALYPVHRLDKPVGGVLIFARHARAADAARVVISARIVEKIYVARVLGTFAPEGGFSKNGLAIADVGLGWDPEGNRAFPVPELTGAGNPDEDKELRCPVPGVVSGGGGGGGGGKAEACADTVHNKKRDRKKARMDYNTQKLAGRPAVTHFRLLGVASDGATSVVECCPLTGRTHQIRAHLAWLGHPIANDAQYGGTYGGPAAARAVAERLGVKWGSNSETLLPLVQSDGAAVEVQQHINTQRLTEEATQFTTKDEFKAPKDLHDGHCIHCPYYSPKDYPIDLRPVWLFARRYSCADWAFEAPMPEWADVEWTPEVPRDSK